MESLDAGDDRKDERSPIYRTKVQRVSDVEVEVKRQVFQGRGGTRCQEEVRNKRERWGIERELVDTNRRVYCELLEQREMREFEWKNRRNGCSTPSRVVLRLD